MPLGHTPALLERLRFHPKTPILGVIYITPFISEVHLGKSLFYKTLILSYIMCCVCTLQNGSGMMLAQWTVAYRTTAAWVYLL